MTKLKLYLSNSSIQVFRECKKRFKYKYIDRVNPGKKITNKHLSFGQSIHSALAEFNMLRDQKYRTLDNLHNLLRKNWIREGYETLEEERQFGLRGLDMLTRYFNNPLDQGKENLIIEKMIKKDMEGKFILCGKLDKVYIRDDGIVEIVDYKTGNNLDDLENTETSLQLPISVILAGEELGFYPQTASYYYLVQNRKIVCEITDKFIKKALHDIWSIYEEIQNEEDFLCSPSPYCEFSCEYYEICDDAKDKSSLIINNLKKFVEEKEKVLF